MPYFLLLIFELILLFALSKKLINALTAILFRVTRNQRAAIHIMAIIFLPGTIFHELAHLLFAGVMLVPVGEMSVMPEIEQNRVKLGSVQIGKADPLRRTIIGVAPVIFGLILIFTALYFIQGANSFIWWQIVLGLYLVFVTGNTMFSSKKDLEGVIVFTAMILIITIAVFFSLYFLKPAILQNLFQFINKLNLEFVLNFFKMADAYLLIPIALDILIVSAGKLFKKLLF